MCRCGIHTGLKRCWETYLRNEAREIKADDRHENTIFELDLDMFLSRAGIRTMSCSVLAWLLEGDACVPCKCTFHAWQMQGPDMKAKLRDHIEDRLLSSHLAHFLI